MAVRRAGLAAPGVIPAPFASMLQMGTPFQSAPPAAPAQSGGFGFGRGDPRLALALGAAGRGLIEGGSRGGLGMALLGATSAALPAFVEGQQILDERADVRARQEEAAARTALQERTVSQGDRRLDLAGRQQRLRESEFGDLQRQRMAARQFAGTLEPQNPQQAIAIRNAQLTGDLGGLSAAFGQASGKPQIFGNTEVGFHALLDGKVTKLVDAVAPGADQQEVFKNTQALRKEASALPSVKGFREALPGIKSAFESAPTDTRAADLDLVFAVGKALDPNSVIREGEQITITRAGSPANQVSGFINSLAGGGRLPPGQRAALLEIGRNRIGALRGSAEEDLVQYGAAARAANLDPALAIPQLEALPAFPELQITPAGGGGLIPEAQAGEGGLAAESNEDLLKSLGL